MSDKKRENSTPFQHLTKMIYTKMRIILFLVHQCRLVCQHLFLFSRAAQRCSGITLP